MWPRRFSTALDGVVVFLDAGRADGDAGVLEEELGVYVAQHLAVALRLDDLRVARETDDEPAHTAETEKRGDSSPNEIAHVYLGLDAAVPFARMLRSGFGHTIAATNQQRGDILPQIRGFFSPPAVLGLNSSTVSDTDLCSTEPPPP